MSDETEVRPPQELAPGPLQAREAKLWDDSPAVHLNPICLPSCASRHSQ